MDITAYRLGRSYQMRLEARNRKQRELEKESIFARRYRELWKGCMEDEVGICILVYTLTALGWF